MRPPTAKFLVLCLTLATAGGTGCATTQERKWYDPFALFQKDEPGPKIRTAADYIKDLKKLADEQAPKMSPEEQERASTELARRLTEEDDTLIRAQILRTMAVLPTSTARAMLSAGLQDQDPDVRVACCEALAHRRGDDALQLLCETVNSDTNEDVRLAAARGLGKLGDQRGIPALAPLLDEENPAMRYRAIQSLEAISGRKYDTLDEWRTFAQGGTVAEPAGLASRLRKLF